MSIQLPTPSHSTAVLWGPRFDEVTATVFVSTLRRRGLRAYLIGIDGPSAIGEHGIIITADRTLSQTYAFFAHVQCIVVPCGTSQYQRAENDPRIVKWLADAVASRKYIVFRDVAVVHESSLSGIAESTERILFYAEHMDLTGFAEGLAARLIADIQRRD